MTTREAPFWRILSAILVASSLAGCFSGTGLAPTGPIDPPSSFALLDVERGQLLYEAQCVGCHTKQMHWRDDSIVGSWSDVLTQVNRWQNNAGQQWNPSDIGDVAAYLNSIFYKMPCSIPGCQGKSTAAITKVKSMAGSQ